MKNEAIQIATKHIEKSNEELIHCADRLYHILEEIKSQTDDQLYHQQILEAISILQIQDIITQRLSKIKNFLQTLDQHVDLKSSPQYLREFAWENEVDQDDIDNMFKEQQRTGNAD